MKRMILACLLLIAPMPANAQKWVDENGKVYYGTPPAGVNVKPAPMTGGTSSSVGSQTPRPTIREGQIGIPPAVSEEEKARWREAAEKYKAPDWKKIQQEMKDRNTERMQQEERRRAIQERQRSRY
jgi:hypothetical protein